jgi:eukaryotic-like serine/threonine-protein kinase
MALTSGTKLGPYEIVSPLGAGGMGEVYRARDTRLERTVAIKILPAHPSSSSELNARFEREARAISSLNHPHICHLYDIGSQDGTAYLVMEYLEGETLADRLRKGALPLKQALEFGVQVAEALATAHRAGILHRDLKPANIMLTANGAKLMDFGLAKPAPALGGTGAPAVSRLTPSTPTLTVAALSSPVKALTQQGTVVGTFQYMAPEELQGAEADARSDVFSLGCVLYEMATGRRAFDGKSQLSVLTAILEKDPGPVSRVQPTSPPALDQVVKTCLEKNPEERFQTAHDVKLQLKWIAGTDSQAGIRVPARRRLRFGWLAAGAAALVALSFGVTYVMFAPRSAPVVRSFIPPPPGTSFTTISPEAGPPVISPDGTRLAFTVRDEKSNVMLYVHPLTSLTAQPLAGTEDASYPFWSPDSREIGFFAGGKLKKIEASGGPPQVLCDAALGRGGAWSKEGVIVFAPGPAQVLLRVSAAGGAPEPASKFDTALAQNSHRWPQFLPDGQHFLFWARSSRGAQEHTLYVASLGSLDAKPLMKSESMAVYVPDYLLFMRDQTLMAQPFNARHLETTGAPTPIAQHVATNSMTNRPIFSASDTGTLVYETGDAMQGWRLGWFTRDGKPAGAVGDLDHYFDPAISPDGTRLAVGVLTGQGTGDVWIFDLVHATKTRLTFGPSTQRFPVWTPDGKTVFYGSTGKGALHIYAKDTDGSSPEHVVLESSDGFEYPECFSPDQRYLVYVRVAADSKTSADIWALPLFGERKPFPIVQTAFRDFEPAVSPDSKWMAYENNESGRNEIYMTAFPGGGAKWQASTNGGSVPRWRGDGRELFFLDSADSVMAVDVSTSGNTIRMGAPHALFHHGGVQIQQGPYAVTADGKKFLINSGDVKEESQPLTLVQNWPAELKK